MWLTQSSLKSTEIPSQSQWLSRWLAALLIVSALFGIFVLDRATETAPVQHLYYLPIIYAAVIFERRGGLAAAAFAIALYHLANHADLTRPYSELDVVQIALFAIVAIVAARLNSDSRRLQMLATTDDLTGLHNLRFFEARLVRMVRGARRAQLPLAMLVLDVDHLKLINDAYGHLAGAGAVRTVGQLLAAHLPKEAVACRYGGDEFAIAIPWCTVSAARDIADTVRAAVHACEPVLAGHSMPQGTLSISIGIADLLPGAQSELLNDGVSDEGTAEGLFRAADKALYLAKSKGRNLTFSV